MAPAALSTALTAITNNHFPSLQRTLINRNYAKLWYGQAVSAVGDSVFRHDARAMGVAGSRQRPVRARCLSVTVAFGSMTPIFERN